MISAVNNNSSYTYKPSFLGYKTVFTRALDEVILNKKPLEEVEQNLLEKFNVLLKRLQKGKSMGSGIEGSVYRIDEKYVLKSPYDLSSSPMNVQINKNNLKNICPNYYGDEVAKIGDYQILKNANPSNKSASIGTSFEPSEKEILNYNNIYLPQCAKLPQKAFDDLAKSLSALNESKLGVFDLINPNNVMLNKKSFKIIDGVFPDTGKNTFSKMIDTLLKKYTVGIYTDYKKELVPIRKEILKKCIIASEKNNLPLKNSENCGIFDYVAGLCDLTEKYPTLKKELESLRTQYPDIKQRLAVLQEMFKKFD